MFNTVCFVLTLTNPLIFSHCKNHQCYTYPKILFITKFFNCVFKLDFVF